jgi:nitrogen fixation/metabolism regulation signal transduction histidine kinase
MDAGTHFVLLDPITRQPVGQIPKDVAGEARERAVGEDSGKALAAMPSMGIDISSAKETINKIRNHEGKQYGTGAWGVVPGVPGTKQRGFVALVKQAQGQVFKQAFESLKGAGAITEQEGKAATEAMARLDRAQTPEDFEIALQDLEVTLDRGMAKLQARAQQGGSQKMMGAPVDGSQGAGIPGFRQSADGWNEVDVGGAQVRIREKR